MDKNALRSSPRSARAVVRSVSVAACVILAACGLFAETFKCDALECTYQRIKDDGTLGPEHKKSRGEIIVINEGDYDLGEGWKVVTPPA